MVVAVSNVRALPAMSLHAYSNISAEVETTPHSPFGRTPAYKCFQSIYPPTAGEWYPSNNPLNRYYKTEADCNEAQATAPQTDPNVISFINDSPHSMKVSGGTTYSSVACKGVARCTGIGYYDKSLNDTLYPAVGTVIPPKGTHDFCLWGSFISLQVLLCFPVLRLFVLYSQRRISRCRLGTQGQRRSRARIHTQIKHCARSLT